MDVSSRGERWLACPNSYSAHMLACDKTPPTDDQISDYLFSPFFKGQRDVALRMLNISHVCPLCLWLLRQGFFIGDHFTFISTTKSS